MLNLLFSIDDIGNMPFSSELRTITFSTMEKVFGKVKSLRVYKQTDKLSIDHIFIFYCVRLDRIRGYWKLYQNKLLLVRLERQRGEVHNSHVHFIMAKAHKFIENFSVFEINSTRIEFILFNIFMTLGGKKLYN